MLSVRNLTCSRGGLPVLEGLSLSLAAGQALVLRGPNGSGKTTLLRTIAGLQPADAGEIVHDEDTLAYAGHLDGVKAVLSVAENLTFWAGLHGQGSIAAAVADFDLAGLEDRAAQHLSAGQRRRLGLARLAVTGRPLWVLDEPTVSLDTASVARFAAAVGGHLRGGGAVLVATHVDLGFDAETLDVTRFRARSLPAHFGEAF